MIHYLDENRFNEFVKVQQKQALVVFTSIGCTSCDLINPEIEQIANEYQGDFLTFKLVEDCAGGLIEEFDIDGFPTAIFFNAGREVHRSVGAQKISMIRLFIQKAMEKINQKRVSLA